MAKIAENPEDYEVDIGQPSGLRKKNILLLSETDKRYAGKRTSRMDLDGKISTETENFKIFYYIILCIQ